MRAYDVPGFRISGPSWLSSERFNIVAKVPAGASETQFRAMLRNLLAERFELVAHTESRQVPAFTLAIDSGGLKMKASPKEAPEGDPPPPSGMPVIGKDGFPEIPPGRTGLWINTNGDHFLIQAHGVTTTVLADLLSQRLDRPVSDETGLTVPYDFNLEFAPVEVGAAAPEDGREGGFSTSIFNAVKQQLGLKLEARKKPVDVVVVDSVRRTPTEN